MFSTILAAGWFDMDFNSHMGNTAFLDKAADVRMMFFSGNGFPMSEFSRLRPGPVIFRHEVEYFREVGLLQEVSVSPSLAGLSNDGRRFAMRSEVARLDGTPCARITSAGGWLDRSARKLVEPPRELLAALRTQAHSDDFAPLPSKGA